MSHEFEWLARLADNLPPDRMRRLLARESLRLIREELQPAVYDENRDAWILLLRIEKRIIEASNLTHARTFRRDLIYPVRRTSTGHRLCRWCYEPVPRPRMAYCGKACLKEVDIRTSAGMLRHYVRERDQGVCAECGCDTKKLKRVLEWAVESQYEWRFGDGSTTRSWFPGRVNLKAEWLRRLGFNTGTSLWEADHIVEVVRGGESILENTQTLCVPCHKNKSKRQAGERARERRGAVLLPFEVAA